MADNTTLDAGSGGDQIRTEDRTGSGPKTPVSLIDVGGTSAEALIGDSGVAMPVRGLAAEDAAASGNPVPAGGRYDVTPRSLEDGDRGEIALDAAGQQYVVDSAVKTAVEVMDDWDESDRAKVNPIVGQAGVAAGAGSVSAATQRATLASDDPAVTALQIIDDWDESDRAKVNPIVGQAGVAAGAGVVGATTQRATLASDDPAVTALQSIENAVNAADGLLVDLGSNNNVTIESGTVELGATSLAALETITVATVTAAIPAGDNNIGNVDIASAIPVGTNQIGRVTAAPETGAIYEGTTALTVKFAKISAASSGENTIVAAVTNKKIRVLSLALVGVGIAVNIYFKDAASGTAIFADGTNPIPIDKSGAAGAGGLILGYNPMGWFQTAESGALILNLSAAQAVAGSISYIEVE